MTDPKPPTTIHVHAARVTTVGRAPTNDVMLTDDTISRHHAVAWWSGEGICVRDIGSRNGSWVHGERIHGSTCVKAGTVVRLGLHLDVVFEVEGLMSGVFAWAVEDMTTGVLHPIRPGRLAIGPDGTIGMGGAHAVVMVVGQREVRLGENGQDRPIAKGETFMVGGRTFRLVEGKLDPNETMEPDLPQLPYAIVAKIDGPRGPQASVLDLHDNRSHTVASENRAVLLYILGKRLLADRTTGLPHGDQGWCADEELFSGIWGRSWTDRSQNLLHVLVYRVRKELEAAGFDPWCIEKRSGFTRACVESAEIDTQPVPTGS